MIKVITKVSRKRKVQKKYIIFWKCQEKDSSEWGLLVRIYWVDSLGSLFVFVKEVIVGIRFYFVMSKGE